MRGVLFCSVSGGRIHAPIRGTSCGRTCSAGENDSTGDESGCSTTAPREIRASAWSRDMPVVSSRYGSKTRVEIVGSDLRIAASLEGAAADADEFE